MKGGARPLKRSAEAQGTIDRLTAEYAALQHRYHDLMVGIDLSGQVTEDLAKVRATEMVAEISAQQRQTREELARVEGGRDEARKFVQQMLAAMTLAAPTRPEVY